MELIERGMAKPAAAATKEALATKSSLDIINQDLVPALDIVGQGFEKGTLFLPQLLMAADAAKAAFQVVKDSMSGSQQELKGKISEARKTAEYARLGVQAARAQKAQLTEENTEEVQPASEDSEKALFMEELAKRALKEGIEIRGDKTDDTDGEDPQ
jgi:cobalamin-dependent methionine synthase I